jgi:hypothetical protein
MGAAGAGAGAGALGAGGFVLTPGLWLGLALEAVVGGAALRAALGRRAETGGAQEGARWR